MNKKELEFLSNVLFDGKLNEKFVALFADLTNKYVADAVFREGLKKSPDRMLSDFGFKLLKGVTYCVEDKGVEIPKSDCHGEKKIYLQFSTEPFSNCNELKDEMLEEVAGGLVDGTTNTTLLNQNNFNYLAAYFYGG